MTDDAQPSPYPLAIIEELVREGRAEWEPGGNGHRIVRMTATGVRYRVVNERPELVEE